MAMAARMVTETRGRPTPRLAPPVPALSDVAAFRETALAMDIHLMPWQENAARYIEALDAAGKHLYREVAIVVARQNGKSELLVPLIVGRLRKGQRIMHTAQDRSLPREVFYRVADVMWENDAELFPLRNDRQTKPRYANGQEEIRLSNGGVYSIVAPTRGGARGPTRDLVIIDELREMDTWDFIAAAKPTLTVSPDPQMLYLSNAGEEISVVLNATRDRRDSDPSLAYLEWSAAPERSSDDLVGWAESNPAMGYEPEGMGLLRETLEADHRAARLDGTLGIFETEHLCRWVTSMRRPLVDAKTWADGEAEVGEPDRPFLAVSMDPAGKRASAYLAWRQPDGTVALRMALEGKGNPINPDRFGEDVRALERKHKVRGTAYDPMTDAALIRYLQRSEPIAGAKYANASAQFVTLVEAGKLRWQDCAAVTNDLTWTTRKENDEKGSFEAVRGKDDRPITAALAAIRAVWLASRPPVAARTRSNAVGF